MLRLPAAGGLLVIPFVGALRAFLAGRTTFGNMMSGQLQASATDRATCPTGAIALAPMAG